MSLLETIDFGNEAGEDIEPNEIENFFVEQSIYNTFLNTKDKIKIITGKKGVGKSLLLQWLSIRFPQNDNNIIIIKCRGSDLTRNQFNLNSKLIDPNDYIRDWMIRICAITNRHIAKMIKFPVSDDQFTLIETAELQGYKQQNLLLSLIGRFSIKIQGLPEGKYNKKVINDEIEILKRINNPKIIFLIDDLDATFQNTDNEKMSLSTFFSACRYLSQDIKDIAFRVTLRTDIWPIIRRYDESLDKIEQYIVPINWNVKDFRNLLCKRIQSQLEHKKIFYQQRQHQSLEEYQEFIISQVFTNKMDWGEFGHYTYKVLYTLSYKRPRWAVQLCKLTQNLAIKENSPLIEKRHIDTVWGEYGYKRISDLVSEHKHQCNTINEIINAFRDCERKLTREQLISIINTRILPHIRVSIDSVITKSPFEVASFLYRIGFIVARSDDGDEYEHYSYDELPDLLSNRTNDDFKMRWEIHPCYREALDIKKLNKYHKLKRGYK